MTHRRPRGPSWIAVLDRAAAGVMARDGFRRFVAPAGGPRPEDGERIALLEARGPSFVASSRFVACGRAEVGADGRIGLSRRVVAPRDRAPSLSAFPSLRVSAGWTHAALGGLRGTLVRATDRDGERIEKALHDAALAFGPAARRPAHRQPRTPGRRALIAGRAAAGASRTARR